MIGDLQMPFEDSMVLSLVGMAFVFAILALLALIVMFMARLIYGKKESAPVAAAAAAAPVAVPAAPVASAPAPLAAEPVTYCGDIKLVGVDEKFAVMIMAIVAQTSGIPLGELKFKSIRALN